MKNEQRLLVSVIMPVYNRQHTVSKAIQSVLDQTYPYFEFIIVNDASTDETEEKIKTFQDVRIRYISHESRKGAPAARNTGIQAAAGEWIAFQDSDDVWEPDKLEKQVRLIFQYAQEEPSPVIYTSFYRYKGDRREYIPSQDQRAKEGYIYKELILGNFITTQAVLVKKEALLRVGGFAEDMPRFQDWELWLRLAQHHPFLWINEPLVHVNYTEQSISSSETKLIEAYEKMLEKYYPLFQKAGKHYLSSFLFSYGHNLCLTGRMGQGRKLLWQSLRENPISTKSIAALVCSFFGSKGYRLIYKFLKGGNA